MEREQQKQNIDQNITLGEIRDQVDVARDLNNSVDPPIPEDFESSVNDAFNSKFGTSGGVDNLEDTGSRELPPDPQLSEVAVEQSQNVSRESAQATTSQQQPVSSTVQQEVVGASDVSLRAVSEDKPPVSQDSAVPQEKPADSVVMNTIEPGVEKTVPKEQKKVSSRTQRAEKPASKTSQKPAPGLKTKSQKVKKQAAPSLPTEQQEVQKSIDVAAQRKAEERKPRSASDRRARLKKIAERRAAQKPSAGETSQDNGSFAGDSINPGIPDL